MSICKKCFKDLGENEFYKTGIKNYRKSACRRCLIAAVNLHRKKEGTRSYNTRHYIKKKSQANKRGISFNITKDEFVQLRQQDTCTYCGDLMQVKTLDRIDPNRGYEPANIAMSCLSCNKLKGYIAPRHIPILERMIEILRRAS